MPPHKSRTERREVELLSPAKLTALRAHIMSLQDDRRTYGLLQARLHGVLRVQGKEWDKSMKCLLCEQESVRFSHTVPKTSVLKGLSDDGHLLTPAGKPFAYDKGQLGKIGVNEASAFPGFCPDHETAFSLYEHESSLDSPEFWQLQVIRTLLYTIRVNEHLLKYIQISHADAINTWREIVKDAILASSVLTASESNRVDKIVQRYFPVEDVFSSAVEWADRLREGNKLILNVLMAAKICADAPGVPRLHVRARKLDVKLPIAMAGVLASSYQQTQLPVAVNILPVSNGTHVIIGQFSSSTEWLDEVMASLSQEAKSCLAVIQHWMYRETADWYMRPSFWESLADETKAQFLDALDSFGTGKEVLEPPLILSA